GAESAAFEYERVVSHDVASSFSEIRVLYRITGHVCVINGAVVALTWWSDLWMTCVEIPCGYLR
ncbi:MAG: hypothetical protein Q4G41_06315, partial [Coriobacteriales bacterium]|nr:hypothetical protein [Coriobacteriales bacterium]